MRKKTESKTPIDHPRHYADTDAIEAWRLGVRKKMEPIDHPPHYTHGGIEAIDVIEAWRLGFALGNAVKYIARADHKGSRLDDLKKARWYLEREIANAERARG